MIPLAVALHHGGDHSGVLGWCLEEGSLSHVRADAIDLAQFSRFQIPDLIFPLPLELL